MRGRWQRTGEKSDGPCEGVRKAGMPVGTGSGLLVVFGVSLYH